MCIPDKDKCLIECEEKYNDYLHLLDRFKHHFLPCNIDIIPNMKGDYKYLFKIKQKQEPLHSGLNSCCL